MQIIKIIAIVAAVIVCVVLALLALGFLMLRVAIDFMERKDNWTDNGKREEKKNDREART